jgi:hypothetical protein
MREETFALALARLVEAQDKAPLAAVFGTGAGPTHEIRRAQSGRLTG